MDSQASKYKDAIVEVLLKRVAPLEEQLAVQGQIIEELVQTLDSLTKMLSVNTGPTLRYSTTLTSTKKDSMQSYKEQQAREQRKKQADLDQLKKAFDLEIIKLNIDENKEKLRFAETANEGDQEFDTEYPDWQEELYR
ncbi:hypothetical protein SteCoe_2095 [Stentor coeruleus]|uniref:Uncharacterized protein n=1 Tax=Stentor coeruleus TaxID=5963 RepID=A0A1R2D055_9CILI|nr:hypothetical protein SteCoe_2095 [Stentor coeruleus]